MTLVLKTAAIFLSLVSVLALPETGRAAGGCECTVSVQGTGCKINQTAIFGFGQEFGVSVLLDQVSWFDCPAKTIASVYLDNKEKIVVTESLCQNFQTKSGEEKGFKMSISCSVSTKEPTIQGKPTSTSTSPTAPANTSAGGGSTKVDGNTVKLMNPIGGKKDSPEGQTNINALVGTAIKQILGVVGSITFAVFVYGGFLWLTSAGNSDQVKKGSETMLWAGIGVCIIFASYAILQFVFTALGS